MDTKTSLLISKFKHCLDNSTWNNKFEVIYFTKKEIKLIINNLEAVDKLKNEIKQMVEERLTEVCNEINNLKQEKTRQEALQECCTDNLKLFVANTNTTMANTINPLDLKMWGFNRGLY